MADVGAGSGGTRLDWMEAIAKVSGGYFWGWLQEVGVVRMG